MIAQSMPWRNVKSIPEIPQEQIYIHQNATFLFAGEYLYYKVYNLNSKTRTYSKISKIAYVELVNENQECVFKHKIRLNNGTGQSDYFIPSNLPSGNYKLLGYTNWMKNAGPNLYFQSDLAILNPYESNQERVLLPKDSLALKNVLEERIKAQERQLTTIQDSAIDIEPDKAQYGNRMKVTVHLEFDDEQVRLGDYSLSVRKVDTITIPQRPMASNFWDGFAEYETTISKKAKGLFFPPELRGELVTGRLTSNTNEYPLNDVIVALAIPGEVGYELKMVNTDENGNFRFNLDHDYTQKSAVVQVIDPNRSNYKVTLDLDNTTSYPGMIFNQFFIAPDMKNMIVDKSIANQIENNHYSVKPDSLKYVSAIIPLDSTRIFTYYLDEYTRFPTIRETIVEVVDLVWSKKMKNGKHVFQILPYNDDSYMDPELLPLVLVDGIPLQDHSHLLDYNARKIKSIGFIRDKYVIGPKIFQGVLNVESFDKDYPFPIEGEHRVVTELFKPKSEKKYFKQEYLAQSTQVNNRLLDFRQQLLWEPHLILNAKTTELTFFTSDVSGNFEICLEGFTQKGRPVSAKEIIRVN